MRDRRLVSKPLWNIWSMALTPSLAASVPLSNSSSLFSMTACCGNLLPSERWPRFRPCMLVRGLPPDVLVCDTWHRAHVIQGEMSKSRPGRPSPCAFRAVNEDVPREPTFSEGHRAVCGHRKHSPWAIQGHELARSPSLHARAELGMECTRPSSSVWTVRCGVCFW